MSSYLSRLRELVSQKEMTLEHSECFNRAFEGFEGDQGSSVLKSQSSYEGNEGMLDKHILQILPLSNAYKDDCINLLSFQKPLPREPSKPSEDLIDSLDCKEKACTSVIEGQVNANRRNLFAIRNGITDRFCGCGDGGKLATFAVCDPGSFYGERWLCEECFDAMQCIPRPVFHRGKSNKLKTKNQGI